MEAREKVIVVGILGMILFVWLVVWPSINSISKKADYQAYQDKNLLEGIDGLIPYEKENKK